MFVRLCVFAVNKLQCEALFEAQRKQFSVLLAVLIIRIPDLRKSILHEVLTDEERRAIIPGWRGYDFRLDRDSLDELDDWSLDANRRGSWELKLVLDWQPFHDQVVEYWGEENLEEWQSALEPTEALKKLMRPRGITFFTFVESWLKYLTQSLDVQHAAFLNVFELHWHLLPGYATLLKAFLIEIRTRPVSKFPDAMLSCSAAFLINNRMLSVFMRMILTRTSVYYRDQVFATFNYIDFWFEVSFTITSNHQRILSCRFSP